MVSGVPTGISFVQLQDVGVARPRKRGFDAMCPSADYPRSNGSADPRPTRPSSRRTPPHRRLPSRVRANASSVAEMPAPQYVDDALASRGRRRAGGARGARRSAPGGRCPGRPAPWRRRSRCRGSGRRGRSGSVSPRNTSGASALSRQGGPASDFRLVGHHLAARARRERRGSLRRGVGADRAASSVHAFQPPSRHGRVVEAVGAQQPPHARRPRHAVAVVDDDRRCRPRRRVLDMPPAKRPGDGEHEVERRVRSAPGRRSTSANALPRDVARVPVGAPGADVVGLAFGCRRVEPGGRPRGSAGRAGSRCSASQVAC